MTEEDNGFDFNTSSGGDKSWKTATWQRRNPYPAQNMHTYCSCPSWNRGVGSFHRRLPMKQYKNSINLPAPGAGTRIPSEFPPPFRDRVGVTLGTAGDYFLDSYLVMNALSRKEVVIVDMRPEEMLEGMTQGKVDAVSTWHPMHIVHSSSHNHLSTGTRFFSTPNSRLGEVQ